MGIKVIHYVFMYYVFKKFLQTIDGAISYRVSFVACLKKGGVLFAQSQSVGSVYEASGWEKID